MSEYVFALQQNGWKGEHSPAYMGEQGPMQGAHLVHQSCRNLQRHTHHDICWLG